MEYIASFDQTVDQTLIWLSRHGRDAFNLFRAVLESGYEVVLWAFNLAPFWAIALVFALIGWRAVGAVFGILTSLGFLLCQAVGLWPETVETMALVISATSMAVIVGTLIGILSGYNKRAEAVISPVMDLLQTIPPYIYLLPSIAFLGYGPATAILATFIVAVPPAVKLTAVGIARTPVAFLELGAATGASDWQTFIKIRLPFAMRSIMTGVNQSLMMAFGMVVIAGIVGSGGLGEAIYKAIRTLDVARSFDAAIAIVVLTIVIDRISQSAAKGAAS